MNLNSEIKFQNFITESATADVNERPSQDPEYINTFYTIISFFTCVTVAFLLHLGFVFTSDEGSATIGVVVFVTESLGFIVQLQGIGL
jgi:hypothetical protein